MPLVQVVVQNGTQHGLTRRAVESALPLFPPSWCRAVETILLCGGSTLDASFHAKERTLAVSWPRRPPFPSKVDALDALVAALAAVAEFGELPKQFSPSSYLTKSQVAATTRALVAGVT